MTGKTIMTVCSCSDPWCRVNGCRIGNAQRYGQQINYGPAYVVPNLHADCLAEIERLRTEVHEMRLWAEEAARAENLNAQDAREERAAVVAWLRTLDDRWGLGASVCGAAADTIERGEHRREEKP
jgi:hypothetical protein